MRAIRITMIRPTDELQHPCHGGKSTEEFGRESTGGSTEEPARPSLHRTIGVEGIVFAVRLDEGDPRTHPFFGLFHY
jgi:hypothetical protein